MMIRNLITQTFSWIVHVIMMGSLKQRAEDDEKIEKNNEFLQHKWPA